ncbi:hypothetical protein [Demequina flava]|uniref:hypothetical protein n=1 Tax=Demequina flava TaxID=1095025 RepID=UPI000ACA4645|nr:hypothetical protein [Demequina flava]
MAVAILAGVVLAVYGIAAMVWPVHLWALSAIFRLRTPENVAPSERHIRYWRAGGAVYATAGTAMAILVALGDEGGSPGVGWALLAGAALTLAMTVYAWRAPTVPNRKLPPDEPGHLPYGVWNVGLCFAIFMMVGFGLNQLTGS